MLDDTGYLPPGVYTQTQFEVPTPPTSIPSRIPILIGTGNELLSRTGLQLVRGSSATIDQRIVDEDETGRAVVAINPDGSVTLGDWDGATLTKLQVRNRPLVNGDGTGTLTNSVGSVSVKINNIPVVVLSVDGRKGIVEIAATPLVTDVVRCTYYFDRTDTLVTDDVSAQVTTTAAILYGINGQNFNMSSINNTLQVSVDGSAQTNITLPIGTAVTAAAVVAAINTAALRTLTASVYVSNLGLTCIALSAAQSIVIGTGSANTVLGITDRTSTARNATFYVFNRPIVDGSNGGVTTTDPATLTVRVAGVQVIPVSVNGTTGAVILSQPPAAGARVTITYYYNTWQDTFDYLENIGVTNIDRCALTVESASISSTYIDGVSFVLKDDTIIWGTAFKVLPGVHTVGATTFGSNQVSSLMVDARAYMASCTPVLNTSVTPNVSSLTQFQLPFQPTTGNGRGNPLGATNFNLLANGRIDLPTNRPDLVIAYWGFNVTDALARGPVTVLKVDSTTSTITLATPVPEGASVYATFYYSVMVDEASVGGSTGGYSLGCVIPGPGGTGTYTVTKLSTAARLYGASLTGKGTDLSVITVNFPSGSEFFPDSRIEGGAPVEELVTVQFATSNTTPAKFAFGSPGPFYFVPSASDHLRVTFDGAADQTGLAAGMDLLHPTGSSRVGALAYLVGDEVGYTPASGETTYNLTSGLDDGVALNVDGDVLTAVTGTVAGATVAHYVAAVNAAAALVAPHYKTATSFGSTTIAVNEYDRLTLHYTGSVSGLSGNQIITLTPGTYATPALLAAQIQTQLATINGVGGLNGTVNCTALATGQLQFTLTLAVADAAGAGYLEFITTAGARDFAVLAGIDTGAATLGIQTKLVQGPIATRYTVATTVGRLPYDRMVLRNRIFPGAGTLTAHSALAQCHLTMQASTGNTKFAIANGETGEAAGGATVMLPSLLGTVGWAGGQIPALHWGDARDSQPAITFYNGSDPTAPANNRFTFFVQNSLITCTFTASGPGTLTALGPVGTAGSALFQLAAAITASGVTGVSAVQEGASIRIVGGGYGQSASLTIGNDSANTILGFASGQTDGRHSVTVRQTVSALMSHAQVPATLSAFLFNAAADVTYFAGKALAKAEKDPTNVDYLYLQSKTLGAGSSIRVDNASAANALAIGTNLIAAAGSGATGQGALVGYFVHSSDTVNGTGSANTSFFNSGSGADGFVGQTYRDSKTGLCLTILPREGGLLYPTGANATITFRVSATHTTNGSIPNLSIPGLETTVTNTDGVAVGDTALVDTYDKNGDEPAVGQVYYVDYTYTKQDFTPKLFFKLADVTREYGPVSPDNPLSLAAYFAFLQGCPVVGTLQVRKQTGYSDASQNDYLSAIDASSGASLPGGIKPRLILPVTPATTQLLSYTAINCDVQSSARYQSERTAIFGCASGTLPQTVRSMARGTGSMRVRIVYPDVTTFSLTDAYGVSREYLVDGRYLAISLGALTFSPLNDVATPWENKRVVGFTALGRILDTVQMNQIAQDGVTVLESNAPFIKVRHGLTTNMTNVLTKTPTVIQIADEMQIRTRDTLQPFVGVKYLPALFSQMEGRLNMMFKRAVAEQLITSYTGISVTADPSDPTGALVEGYFVPVFPLIYIKVQFFLRSQSSAAA